MKNKLLILMILLFALPFLSAAELELVKDNRSEHSIYLLPQAPNSVKEAALELQYYIEKSSGVKLPVVSAPKEPMFALGDTPEARKAGILPENMPEEGFRIETKGRNIFIAGRDTGDNERTKGGGFSDGTYYGAMEFLERYLGVRWLMPGPDGEDVPEHKNFKTPAISLAGAPDFNSREAYMSRTREETQWLHRMRADVRRQPKQLSCNHAWDNYGMVERLKSHPDYMAMVKGKRLPIEGQTDVSGKFKAGREPWKFCTSSEGLLDLYSGAVLDDMAGCSIPWRRMWSISPNDGGGWCECEKCKVLDEACAWPGARMCQNQSLTRRMITFYNEIAKRVRAKQPDKTLGCFIYASYTYPPEKPLMTEPNLFLMLAARPYYGYTLYREDMSKEFIRLLEAWSAAAPGRLGWFDFSVYAGLLKCSAGAPYPPGIKILRTVFPALKKYQVKDVFWAAQLPWSHGAVNSYIVCRLLWDAGADVEALEKEWLDRAYGPGGEPMLKLYNLLEEKVAEHKQTSPDFFQYRCTPDQVKKIHLPIFPQMEALYKEALSKTETDAQRKRLRMFGDDLTLLHWNMRKAGWLAEPEKSIFYRSDDDFKKFAMERCGADSAKLRKFMTPQLLEKSEKASAHE